MSDSEAERIFMRLRDTHVWQTAADLNRHIGTQSDTLIKVMIHHLRRSLPADLEIEGAKGQGYRMRRVVD